ncbi:MAG: outer membrane beta-barrel protein [Ferruginibacter sp.]|nr:outer membrane beta-barrel protein [Ferruginibacter sp.]
MKKCILSILLFTLIEGAFAQTDYATVQQGEFGITAGAAHYFGDLNTRAQLNRPKPAIGVFYRKQFNNYLALRVSAHYAQVGYSDIYSKNAYQQARNLSFNSDIVEFAVSGDFNFFKFVPGDPEFSFTPYATIGVGIFSYNPYAYLNGKKVFLRPLGTEGQNIGYLGADGKKRSPYGSTAICIPIGLGLKYSLNNNLTLSFQIAERLTTTDYLDDVSSTYVGIDKFPAVNGAPSVAGILQDRSFEKGSIIGAEGKQRGWSKQNDQYIIAEIGLSFNISSYRCPSVR